MEIVSIAQEYRRRSLQVSNAHAAVIQSSVRELRLAGCSRKEKKENSWSLGYFTPCYDTANTAPPPLLPLLSSRSNPPTCFFHLSTTTVRPSPRRRGKFHVAAVAVLHHLGHDEQCPSSSPPALSFVSHESPRANYPRGIDGDCFTFTLRLFCSPFLPYFRH